MTVTDIILALIIAAAVTAAAVKTFRRAHRGDCCGSCTKCCGCNNSDERKKTNFAGKTDDHDAGR